RWPSWPPRLGTRRTSGRSLPHLVPGADSVALGVVGGADAARAPEEQAGRALLKRPRAVAAVLAGHRSRMGLDLGPPRQRRYVLEGQLVQVPLGPGEERAGVLAHSSSSSPDLSLPNILPPPNSVCAISCNCAMFSGERAFLSTSAGIVSPTFVTWSSGDSAG